MYISVDNQMHVCLYIYIHIYTAVLNFSYTMLHSAMLCGTMRINAMACIAIGSLLQHNAVNG